jgi:hypothetical protein
MITSQRFEQAINKLYNAFHADELVPECCNRCAVGNICDNHDRWKHLTDEHGSVVLNYVGIVNEKFEKRINGYLPSELLRIEAVFLKGCGYSLPLNYKSKRPADPTSKEILFQGLCATVSFLCELDDIPDVMDCSKLFEYEKPETLVFSC